ncbi:NAD(P)/FAD-dependent oxidoreductase [Sporichthya sp.]|uniref:protoporphyrinogen/coproporphyrinogen oxidase n=1 Tax=Sporichthya sp. TaxID=65475 RepID=UPI0025F37F6E|nr:FAD-dependent oxidoreductase [Sporichthya sp.]
MPDAAGTPEPADLPPGQPDIETISLTSTERTSVDLLVLGAGTAGLAAAARAAHRGRSVLVLDHAEHVGGLAASFDLAGMSVDYGSHRLPERLAPDVESDLEELLGGDLQTRRRTARVRVADRWVPLERSTSDLRRLLPHPMATAMAWDTGRSGLRRRGGADYAAAMKARVGRRIYDAVYEPYARKLWDQPGNRLDADAAGRIVSADITWRSGRRYRAAGSEFRYPRQGFGQIPTVLAETAVAAGATIRLGTEIDAIEPAFGSVIVRTLDGASLTGRHAFSTLPLPRLARSTRPGPPLGAIETATRLRFRAMVLVFLVHEGGRWSPFDCHHFPADDTPVLRLSEPANYRDNSDDPTGHTVLCAEMPCAVGDEIWSANDVELAELVEEAAARTDLPDIKVAEVQVHRSAMYYPSYTLGYDRDLKGLDSWLRGIPSVTSFGRFGLFFHDNTHHALLLAREAGNALGPEGTFDHLAWERGRERVEALLD